MFLPTNGVYVCILYTTNCAEGSREQCCSVKWSLKLSHLNENLYGSTIVSNSLQYLMKIVVGYPFSSNGRSGRRSYLNRRSAGL